MISLGLTMIARWTSEERVDDRFAMLSCLGNDRFDPHLARFAQFSVGAEVWVAHEELLRTESGKKELLCDRWLWLQFEYHKLSIVCRAFCFRHLTWIASVDP